MCLQRYYHYTDWEGLQGILDSRRIYKSSSGVFGKGVYFTTLSPHHGRLKIAKNNWDGIWRRTEGSGKVDFTVAVMLPDTKMKKCKGDIYVIREDVNIDVTDYWLYSTTGDHRLLDDDHDGDLDDADQDDANAADMMFMF